MSADHELANQQPDPTLAIHGGAAALPEGPPSWPLADEAVRRSLEAAYHDGSWGRYHGPNCEQLAEQLARRHDVEHALLCCSGTYAVEAALRGLGIEAGDEVILAGYDFPGNFRAVEVLGARPVLVDIDPHTWSLDAEQLPAAVSDRTRAVIVSHLHGGMAPMRRLMELAREHGLGVVEDACQSPGARVDGRLAGTWGDVGVLSFGGSKLLTAGRGGALITSRGEVYQRAKIYGQRGNDAFPLSELQAAVLLPQLETLEARNQQRRANVARLFEKTKDLSPLVPVMQAADAQTAEPSFYKLAWRYEPEALGCEEAASVTREDWIAAAKAEGVAMDAGFRGFAGRGERRCRKVGSLEHSVRAAERTLLLHHPVLLAESDVIDRVVVALAKISVALARGTLTAPSS